MDPLHCFFCGHQAVYATQELPPSSPVQMACVRCGARGDRVEVEDRRADIAIQEAEDTWQLVADCFRRGADRMVRGPDG